MFFFEASFAEKIGEFWHFNYAFRLFAGQCGFIAGGFSWSKNHIQNELAFGFQTLIISGQNKRYIKVSVDEYW